MNNTPNFDTEFQNIKNKLNTLKCGNIKNGKIDFIFKKIEALFDWLLF